MYSSKQGARTALAIHSATPQEGSTTLRELVQALIDGGVLNLGQGYALVSYLNKIDRHLGDREKEEAAELFQAFIDQVQGFMSEGLPTADQGQPMIDAAQNAIDQLKAQTGGA
jgi:hypothetical protein